MDIPIFPDSLPVSLESRELFYAAYRHSPPTVADQVFNNLFGWQEFFGYRYSRVGDFLFVFSLANGRAVFLPPFLLAGAISDPAWAAAFADACRTIRDRCRATGRTAEFRFFPEVYLRQLPPAAFRTYPDRDSYDYVYRRSDLAELPGKQYAAKRNLIRQFSRQYRYRFETLRRENLSCIYRFIRHWEPAGGAAAPDTVATGEAGMVYRLLKHYDVLGLCGGVLFVDGREVAATLASVVPDFTYTDGAFSTVIVHSEHALVEYKGAYQMINQLFCASLPADVVFVNREEDLGIAGLRKAKLSYGPQRLLSKSRIALAVQELIPTGGVMHEDHQQYDH
jgi:hypothetical protein